MKPFSKFMDLASERAGGCVIAASDDFFALKENLIKDADPVFIPGKHTDRGKWMDGWESRRRRTPGHDWAIVRLGIPGVIHGIVVDTSHFTGNYPECCSLEGCTADGNPGREDLRDWLELLPSSRLHGDKQNPFQISCAQRFTHLRLNIFPDGGVARLRVYGEALPDWQRLSAEIDLVSAECGGTVVDSSDQHYGHPQNLIMPGRALDMSDGWETRRRRGPGHDWVILKLAAEGIIERVEVDTAHFKGNFPDRCSLEISPSIEGDSWSELLPETALQAHTRHIFHEELVREQPARYVRFNIFPDGGVSRLRLFGYLTEHGHREASLKALNAVPADEAAADFLQCCGSKTWATAMAAGRPYDSVEALEESAERVWRKCSPQDWLEAFAAHPKIGQQSGGQWSRQEQSAVSAADLDTLAGLAEENRKYEEKFGHIFIVCATGKSAKEILDLLRARLKHSSSEEMTQAGEEQLGITRLRLRKLLSE
ncbi:MAG TPA: allantoicase [Terriglobales bacterium]|nr:allantoicase [Terriglobales bacterium]